MRRAVFLFFLSQLLVFTTAASHTAAGPWSYQPRKRLTIGGAMVEALAEFQRHGGQVDEILTPDDLVGKPPLIYGVQNGRSVFALSGGRDGGMAGLVTVDGSSVEASMTPDGFLELKPDQTGVRNRNMDLYRALFPELAHSEYTTEAVFEFIDESGKRLIFGGSEDGKTTSFLFKKDAATGELVYKVRRDIAKNKEAKEGWWVEPDESSTFPVRFKVCDENRENCAVRTIIKKPGDEIRINPTTQAMKVTFNKDVLPYYRKYGNAQRLGWACDYKGEGFYFTYREGFMGGDARKLGLRIGSLACDKNVLCCKRSGPGQKCNFDYRDYLDQPHVMMLFGLNWLTSRLDPHKQHFTVTLDKEVEKHLRVKKFENMGCIKTAKPLRRPAAPGNDVSVRLYETLKAALCPSVGGACAGEPTFSVLDVTGVNEGITLVDERTGVRLKDVTRATVYALRNNYGTGKRGDFVGTVVDNRTGGAVVSTLLQMEDTPKAPDLIDKKDQIPPENIEAIVAEMKKEEEAEEVQRMELASRQRALVLFPARHGWGFASQPTDAKKVAWGPRPARVVLMPPAEEEAPHPVAAPPPAAPALTSRFATASRPFGLSRVERPPAYARPLETRSQTSRYAASAPSVGRVPVAPTATRSRASFLSRPGPPPTDIRLGSEPGDIYIGPRTGRMPVSSLPPSSFVASPKKAPAARESFYRTAAADLASKQSGADLGTTRARVPIRLPLQGEEQPQKASIVHKTAYHSLSEAPEPSSKTLEVATESPVEVLEGGAPEPSTRAKVIELRPPKPKPVRVTRSLVREVQRRLKRQGYTIRRVDGRLGRETARALRRFQRDVSLRSTGRIDRSVLESLGIDADNGWSARRAPIARPPRKTRTKRWRPSRAQIREVQRRLALIGYKAGPADGLYGRQTARAVKRFQRQVGLKPTGRVDRQILHRLSISP